MHALQGGDAEAQVDDLAVVRQAALTPVGRALLSLRDVLQRRSTTAAGAVRCAALIQHTRCALSEGHVGLHAAMARVEFHTGRVTKELAAQNPSLEVGAEHAAVHVKL